MMKVLLLLVAIVLVSAETSDVSEQMLEVTKRGLAHAFPLVQSEEKTSLSPRYTCDCEYLDKTWVSSSTTEQSGFTSVYTVESKVKSNGDATVKMTSSVTGQGISYTCSMALAGKFSGMSLNGCSGEFDNFKYTSCSISAGGEACSTACTVAQQYEFLAGNGKLYYSDDCKCVTSGVEVNDELAYSYLKGTNPKSCDFGDLDADAKVYYSVTIVTVKGTSFDQKAFRNTIAKVLNVNVKIVVIGDVVEVTVTDSESRRRQTTNGYAVEVQLSSKSRETANNLANELVSEVQNNPSSFAPFDVKDAKVAASAPAATLLVSLSFLCAAFILSLVM